MIQSLPLLSQVGGRTRFFMEQAEANYDPSHGPTLLTLSSQRVNYIEPGGPSNCRAGLDFYNTRAKAEMISVDWESPIIGSAEFPSGRQGSPARNWLSMGNSLDKTADREFKAGKSEECTQNSPASFQPELSVNLSMRSRPFDQQSEPRTGFQQIRQSAINAAPNPYNASPLYDGDQSRPRSPHSIGRQDDQVRTHNFPASCAHSTEIDRPSEINNPVLSSTEFPVQRSTAREPWINRLYRLEEAHERVHDQKLWTPLKKMARKNNMAAATTCKNSMEEANNSGHAVGSRNGAAARTCVDCCTTKTPLWRTGPRGPKSLCNACGIRYRKTRRAALSECIDGNAAGSPKRKTEEKLIHLKKRSRLSMASCKKNIGLENHSAFQRVFAEEEEEAAVLLMALSCGLVHG